MTPYHIGLTGVKVPSYLTHVSTSWQVSRTKTFDSGDLIYDEPNDTTNKLEINIELDFTVRDTYYARAKIHFSNGGYDGWYKPITLVKDSEGYSHSNTVIVTPRITLSHDTDHLPLGGFTIHGSDYEIFSGVGNHEFTTWGIRQANGLLVWTSEMDSVNLTEIRVPVGLLDPNQLYVIECTYYADSNEMSNKGRAYAHTVGVEQGSVDVPTDGPSDLIEDYEDAVATLSDVLQMQVNHYALRMNHTDDGYECCED